MLIHTFENSLSKSEWSKNPVDVFVIGKNIFPSANGETVEPKKERDLSLDEINEQSEGIEFLPAVSWKDLSFESYQRDAANDAQYGKKDSA